MVLQCYLGIDLLVISGCQSRNKGTATVESTVCADALCAKSIHYVTKQRIESTSYILFRNSRFAIIFSRSRFVAATNFG